MTPRHTIWDEDGYDVEVVVTRMADGEPFVLTDATITSVAGSAELSIAAAEIIVTDAAAGIFRARWADGSFPPGMLTVQHRVAPVDDLPQTVAEYGLRVRKSI